MRINYLYLLFFDVFQDKYVFQIIANTWTNTTCIFNGTREKFIIWNAGQIVQFISTISKYCPFTSRLFSSQDFPFTTPKTGKKMAKNPGAKINWSAAIFFTPFVNFASVGFPTNRFNTLYHCVRAGPYKKNKLWTFWIRNWSEAVSLKWVNLYLVCEPPPPPPLPS